MPRVKTNTWQILLRNCNQNVVLIVVTGTHRICLIHGILQYKQFQFILFYLSHQTNKRPNINVNNNPNNSNNSNITTSSNNTSNNNSTMNSNRSNYQQSSVGGSGTLKLTINQIYSVEPLRIKLNESDEPRAPSLDESEVLIKKLFELYKQQKQQVKRSI